MMRRAGALVLSLLALSAADRPAATKADEAAREKALIALLADSTWESRWHAFSPEGFTKGGENRYRIVRAQKVKGDDWVIFGGFELEGKPVELPLPAKIFWADDTPVMSMTGLALPGGKQNPGETLSQPAQREFLEETGLLLTIEKTLETRAEEGRDPRGAPAPTRSRSPATPDLPGRRPKRVASYMGHMDASTLSGETCIIPWPETETRGQMPESS